MHVGCGAGGVCVCGGGGGQGRMWGRVQGSKKVQLLTMHDKRLLHAHMVGFTTLYASLPHSAPGAPLCCCCCCCCPGGVCKALKCVCTLGVMVLTERVLGYRQAHCHCPARLASNNDVITHQSYRAVCRWQVERVQIMSLQENVWVGGWRGGMRRWGRAQGSKKRAIYSTDHSFEH